MDGKTHTREVTLGYDLHINFIITVGLNESEQVIKNADFVTYEEPITMMYIQIFFEIKFHSYEKNCHHLKILQIVL